MKYEWTQHNTTEINKKYRKKNDENETENFSSNFTKTRQDDLILAVRIKLFRFNGLK